MSDSSATRPRRFRPCYRHQDTQEFTGNARTTSIELLQQDLSQWTLTDFVALCDIYKVVWIGNDICVCYRHKQTFPPPPCGNSAAFVLSLPECDSDVFRQHLHVLVRCSKTMSCEETQQMLQTIMEGILDMVARSTTLWAAIGTLQASSYPDSRIALPYKIDVLTKQLATLRTSDPKQRPRKLVFWNLRVTDQQCSAATEGLNGGSEVTVQFQSCDFNSPASKAQYSSKSPYPLLECMSRLYPWTEKEKKMKKTSLKNRSKRKSAEEASERMASRGNKSEPSQNEVEDEKSGTKQNSSAQLHEDKMDVSTEKSAAATTVEPPKIHSKPSKQSRNKLFFLVVAFSVLALYFLWLSSNGAAAKQLQLRGAAAGRN